MAPRVAEALWKATKTLYAEGKRRRRDTARQEKADQRRERQQESESRGCSLKEAATRVLTAAVEKATGGGRYPVSAHTLFYSVRPLVQRFTKDVLNSHYFEQKLLPAYQREHGAIEGLYYEPRGILYEPHTGVEVPLGTREVEAYRFPIWLYDKILFVEKKGLWPVLKAAHLAERYDMAIVAGEGYATEACRVLLANAERGRDYQLFVVHDADPYGYNIARTLREATARMPGHRAEVIDLGLKLEEALELGLPAEEFTRRKALPQGLELTPLEQEYFEGRQATATTWVCKRVELNAFTAPGLIGWAEQKLGAAGVRGKVVPPAEEMPALAEGMYAGAVGAWVRGALEELLDCGDISRRLADLVRPEVGLGDARRWAEEAVAGDRKACWRNAVGDRLSARLQRLAPRLRQELLAAMVEAIRRLPGTAGDG
jgi:hypothetical protein